MTASNPMLDFVRKYRHAPGKFVRECMGAEPLEWQDELLDVVCVQRKRRVSVRSGHGVGKGHPKSLMIETPTGKKRWGDLAPGDMVFGADGAPTRIKAVYDRGVIPTYRVTFDDGSSTVVDGDHLWNVRGRQERRRKVGGYRTISTADLIAEGVTRPNGASRARQWEIPIQGAAHFEQASPLPFDPYWVGVWIGDGTKGEPCYHKPVDEIAYRLRRRGVPVRIPEDRSARYVAKGLSGWRQYPLARCGSPDRYVPDEYKYASVANRTALLQGLLDTDGEVVHTGAIEYATTSEKLAHDVVWLCRSLGYKAKLRPTVKPGRYRGKDGGVVECRDCWRVGINMPHNPFTHPAKAAKFKPSEHRYRVRWITDISPVGEEDITCISVEAEDQLYLCNDFITTHNTTGLAWAMIHTLVFTGECKVICTAPAAGTLFDGLMAEVKKWIAELPDFLKELFDTTTEHVRLKSMPTACFISARTSSVDKPEALAGIHAPRVLLVVDEASGVPEAVFKAAAGSMSTANATTVLIGNPTRNSGYFFDTHHKLREMWHCMHVSCLGNRNVDPDFIAQIKKQYGEDSNEYRIRVLGEFPRDDGESYLARDSIERAMARTFEVPDDMPEVWGLDVARTGGDRVALARRKGPVIPDVLAWSGRDLMGTVGVVKAFWDEIPPEQRPVEILVDAIGMGAGVADRLVELGLPAIAVNVSETSGPLGQGARMRDDLWVRMKLALNEDALALVYDEELANELATPRGEYLSNGRVKIEGKREMRRRGYPSPDKADAVLLTLYSNASPLDLISTAPNSRSAGYRRRRGPIRRNLNVVV